MLKAILVSAAFVFFSQFAHAQNAQPRRPACVTERVLFIPNQDVSGKQTVKSGGTCNGGISGGLLNLTEIQFVEPPRHGTLRRTSRFNYSYTPKAGYAGPDRYKVRYVGHQVDFQGNKTFDVTFGHINEVTVTP